MFVIPVSFNLLTTFFRSLHSRCTVPISLSWINLATSPIFSSSQWSLFLLFPCLFYLWVLRLVRNLPDTHYLTPSTSYFLCQLQVYSMFTLVGMTVVAFYILLCRKHCHWVATSALLIGLIQMKYLYSNLDILKIAWEFEVLRLMRARISALTSSFLDNQ